MKQRNNMERGISTEQRAHEQLQSFLSDCNIENPQGKKTLEIGFKNGLFLDECRKAGLIATGLEINKEYLEKVKKEFPHLDLRWYDGGKFPIPDNYFDFVVSFQVLEHVNSTEHIIKECLRVLKDGGIMYHICPNYHSFYEGHYQVFWLPFLNKKTARIYLKLLGHYTSYFEGLNIIKPKHIIKVFKKYQNELEMISLGKKEFIRKFNPEQIEKVNQRFLKKCLKVLNAIPAIKKCFLWTACATGFYYPITVISRKKTSFQEK
ncbi:MAG: class I SAM-dependent methyltransferase [Sedimentisphaerales bacterium]